MSGWVPLEDDSPHKVTVEDQARHEKGHREDLKKAISQTGQTRVSVSSERGKVNAGEVGGGQVSGLAGALAKLGSVEGHICRVHE